MRVNIWEGRKKPVKRHIRGVEQVQYIATVAKDDRGCRMASLSGWIGLVGLHLEVLAENFLSRMLNQETLKL